MFSWPRIQTIRLVLAAMGILIGQMAIRPEQARAEQPEAEQAAGIAFFEKQIRPLLVRHCIRCHGPEEENGGLRLDSRDAWKLGGDSGPAILPGKPSESLLIQAISYQDSDLEMPPKGILPKAAIAAFQKWVARGAADPRVASAPLSKRNKGVSLEEGRSFWSFQPVVKHQPPEASGAEWAETDIDRFVLAGLAEKDLAPGADADKASLVQRVYFDLLGLPPTPEQQDAFLNDRSPRAYEKLLDSLLSSPHFGERWGRHWLDVVRFAESSGGGRTLFFPDAWRYRDYVIESFNQDAPYDRFLREQLAGDLLEFSDWRQRRRQLIATGFLVLGPTNYEMQDKEVLETDVIDEQLDTLGKALLGMTIGCARCHDHKFDPITLQDYYGLAGIFQSTTAAVHDGNVSRWNVAPLPESAEIEKEIAAREEQISALKKQLAVLQANWKAAGGKDGKASPKSIASASLAGVVVDDVAAKIVGQWKPSTSIKTYIDASYLYASGKGAKSVSFHPVLPQAGRYEVRIAYAAGPNRTSHAPVTVVHQGGEAVVSVNQRQTPKIGGAFESLGVFEFDPDREPRVSVSNKGVDDGVVIADAVQFISVSGKVAATGKIAVAAQLASSEQKERKKQREQLQEQLGADIKKLETQIKALAAAGPQRQFAMVAKDEAAPNDTHISIRGVVHNQGPIVPRSALQVVRAAPFAAIAKKQSGRYELAQWLTHAENPLTSRLMVNRVWYWLMGQGLVRTVDNFGSTGERPSHPELLDYLAASFVEDGWSVKRLIRQIMLSHAYRLSTQEQPAAKQVDPDNRLLSHMNRKRLEAEQIRDALLLVSGQLDTAYGGANFKPGTKGEYGYQFDGLRRSVYVPVFRNTLPQVFEVFDFADPNIQNGRRGASTIAPQALWLMNHPFVMEQARLAAGRLLEQESLTQTQRLERVYREVLGRRPSAKEQSLGQQFVGETNQENTPPKEPALKRWALLYQALFQSIDFRYLN